MSGSLFKPSSVFSRELTAQTLHYIWCPSCKTLVRNYWVYIRVLSLKDKKPAEAGDFLLVKEERGGVIHSTPLAHIA